MDIKQALLKFTKVEEDPQLQNLIAQANARYILFNTNETKETFPKYTIKDDKLCILAFYYLHLGCSFAENKSFENARVPLEKGASILEYVHGSISNRTKLSNYYGLISALSYYVCFQYSKSFILINKFENTSPLSKVLSLYLKRDFKELINEVSRIAVDISYRDDVLAEKYDEIDGETKIYEIIVAKSLNLFVQYFYTGNENYLNQARVNLSNLKKIAELKADPGIWWVIRLMILISDGINNASIWQVLKEHFDISSDIIKKYIYSLVFLPPRGIYELFITQRNSLTKVLNKQNKGCVVSIPTSSGKTRIAEIAILDSLTKNRDSKVLYIAPFRSLAFEIENSLEKVFEESNFVVSQLYGGGLFSKLDEKIINDSQIVIATPEKAKAILRGNSDILNNIKLVVIDEGHLFGPNKRLIINEIFYEELKFFINQNNGKFLLLSAVLPNADEFATWLTDSTDTAYKDSWRPSDERFGILEWTGSYVNLYWKNNDPERATFNNRFIVTEQQPLIARQRKFRFFPSDKNEAVAATAFKLRIFGPTLIFVGRKASVFTMAKAYLKCLGQAPKDFHWKNQFDWKVFELSCLETYGENSNWLHYARKGILCHNADLHPDVRIPLERLMRNDKPLVIIATSTLGQGVNLCVSSVIFSTLYQGNNHLIDNKDFWNISGRAGRAFIDHEGKVLLALDTSENSTKEDIYKIRYNRKLVNDFLDKNKIAPVKSGILELLKLLKVFAHKNGVSFELLTQLISENKPHDLGEWAEDIDEYLDWIDDSLLALLEINNQTTEEIDYVWIEEFFRKSLAYIQATNEAVITGDEVIKLIRSRIKGIVKKVGSNKVRWKSIIKSGIPLNSSLIIEDKLPLIIETIGNFQLLEPNIENKIELLRTIENVIKDLPVILQDGVQFNDEKFDIIRNIWLKGKPLSELKDIKNATDIINKYYIYILPWLLNAIAAKLRTLSLDDKAEILEELSILIEVGLPNINAMKIYRAGIRSRAAAKEISNLINDAPRNIISIKDLKYDLVHNKDSYRFLVSKPTMEWIELLSLISQKKVIRINVIPPFTFIDENNHSEILIAREINERQFLLSPDLSYFKDVSDSAINFKTINNIHGVYFKFNPNIKLWEMIIDNPYIKPN